MSNSADGTNAPRSIIGLDPASEPEVQAEVVAGFNAATMHRILGNPGERCARVHAVERSDRVGPGGIFVSSPAFERDNVAFKLKDVEIDPSQ